MTDLIRTISGGIALALASVLPFAAQAQTPSRQGMPSGSSTPVNTAMDEQLIRSAMEAAPKRVGADATILASGTDGKMRTLRQGTNGFTCMPDNPATPSRDPMCMDKAALQWVNAWMSRATPQSGRTGLIYMLAGGTDASNTDPFATKPMPGNHWIETGAHVMIVGADPTFYDMYPKAAAPDTSAPYVMWANTPYQHLMVPVK